jgi:hypothetical protein
MTVAIVGLTVFSPVFRNLQLSEENARLSLDNRRIEQELSGRRDERRQIEMANQATREELDRRRAELEQLQQSNRAMAEELDRRRGEQLLLLETSRRALEQLAQRRAELRQLGAAAREQRAAAWGYVCNQIRIGASMRLERDVSELGLGMMRWLQEGVDLGRHTGAALLVHDQVPAWTQTLSPDVRARFDTFLARFTSMRQALLVRQYIRRSGAVEAGFEADQDLAMQLRTVIARFEDECHASQP